MNKMFKKLAILTGVAAAIGYVAGVLTAPKSGKETREDLRKSAQKGMSEAEKQLKQTLTELTDIIDELKKRSESMGERASKQLEDLVTKGKTARGKAREVLSAIHEGDANDKDLHEAVTQASDALKHLRVYLNK